MRLCLSVAGKHYKEFLSPTKACRMTILYIAHYEKCPPSFTCGNLGNISFPFTVSQHPHCGILALDGCDYHVPEAPKSIQMISNTPTPRFDLVKIVDSRSITITNNTLRKYLGSRSCKTFSYDIGLLLSSPLGSLQIKYNITLFRCNKSLSVTPLQNFHNYTNCFDCNIYYGLPNIGDDPNFLSPSSLTACSKIQLALKGEPNNSDPFSFLSGDLFLQIHLSDDCKQCYYHKGGYCQLDSQGKFYCAGDDRSWLKMKLGVILVVTVTLVVLVMATLCYTRRKKKNPKHLEVDAFLERHGHLQIKRYSYSELKKVTSSFTNKLGQGGFGSVFKGQLQDGRHVAVKLLSELKGDDGEEFINEVASMTRTSHVNIVALLGFCFEDCKPALVYEFMANGSLEKFIYEENAMAMDRQLDCQTLYDIAIGVARGLEYLHKGCNTRILHFDIKPHNILLDENLCPKISDFGLAKICTRKESMVSIFGARGTAGYIAPEVFSRNFGAVSHKSDVYSYGMMVLEMVGRRKNIKANANASSEIYFPHWIYNRLVSHQELCQQSVENGSDDEKLRKMTIVSLWCIQTKPSTRPSITKVVEMLEGRVELSQLPPKPFWFTPENSPDQSSSEQ